MSCGRAGILALRAAAAGSPSRSLRSEVDSGSLSRCLGGRPCTGSRAGSISCSLGYRPGSGSRAGSLPCALGGRTGPGSRACSISCALGSRTGAGGRTGSLACSLGYRPGSSRPGSLPCALGGRTGPGGRISRLAGDLRRTAYTGRGGSLRTGCRSLGRSFPLQIGNLELTGLTALSVLRPANASA